MSKPGPLTCRYVSVKEAAEYINFAVPTMYTMVSQRRIPFVRLGRTVRFDLRQLDEWIKKHTVMPMPPK